MGNIFKLPGRNPWPSNARKASIARKRAILLEVAAIMGDAFDVAQAVRELDVTPAFVVNALEGEPW